MLDRDQFMTEIIKPTLVHLGLWSKSAGNLIIGTAYQESRLKYLRQIGGGPALGLYQIEPSTHHDLFENFLSYRHQLKFLLTELETSCILSDNNLITNLMYATAVCRLIYYRVPEKLPEFDDIEGLARYWKQYYNTPLGKGTVNEWVSNYKELMK